MDVLDAHFLHAAILNDSKDFASARREYMAILRLLDDPRLVLYSYVGKRDRAQSAESIKAVAREHIKRIDEGRTLPEDQTGLAPNDLPKEIPVEKAMRERFQPSPIPTPPNNSGVPRNPNVK